MLKKDRRSSISMDENSGNVIKTLCNGAHTQPSIVCIGMHQQEDETRAPTRQRIVKSRNEHSTEKLDAKKKRRRETATDFSGNAETKSGGRARLKRTKPVKCNQFDNEDMEKPSTSSKPVKQHSNDNKERVLPEYNRDDVDNAVGFSPECNAATGVDAVDNLNESAELTDRMSYLYCRKPPELSNEQLAQQEDVIDVWDIENEQLKQQAPPDKPQTTFDLNDLASVEGMSHDTLNFLQEDMKRFAENQRRPVLRVEEIELKDLTRNYMKGVNSGLDQLCPGRSTIYVEPKIESSDSDD